MPRSGARENDVGNARGRFDGGGRGCRLGAATVLAALMLLTGCAAPPELWAPSAPGPYPTFAPLEEPRPAAPRGTAADELVVRARLQRLAAAQRSAADRGDAAEAARLAAELRALAARHGPEALAAIEGR